MSERYTEAEVLARIDGLTVARLRSFAAARCVRPQIRGGGPTFAAPDLARLRLLRELEADFDLDEDAAALVLQLLDQIHGLRVELRALVEAVGRQPAEVRRRIVAEAAAARAAGADGD
jgi:chaperone modulatory protein CbpM